MKIVLKAALGIVSEQIICREYKGHRKFAPAIKEMIVQRYVIGSEKIGLFCFDSWGNLCKCIKLTLLDTRGQTQGLQRDTVYDSIPFVTGRLNTSKKARRNGSGKKKEGGKNK